MYRQVPANSAFEARKAKLAAELTDTLENIRYLFEINAAIIASEALTVTHFILYIDSKGLL